MSDYMRLGEFISANIEPILAGWEAFARSLAAGRKMEKLALRNDAESILLATVRDMRTPQSPAQQASKSRGHGGAGGAESDRLDDASSLHGASRVGSGFNLDEVVSEYRALRASVLRLWRESGPDPDINDLDDITRFNESMDQSLARAVAAYTARVDQARRMFLAILAHDLRNPLNTISLTAQLAAQGDALDTDTADAFAQIETSVEAIARLVSDLIDFASSGLGSVMPLSPAPMSLERLCREVTRGFQAAHPDRKFVCEAHGDLTLTADAARLRQVLSNLLGNAIQHGEVASPITVSLNGLPEAIVFSVHNTGVPIPAAMRASIFNPLVRNGSSPGAHRHGSLGLGLYIVREIVVAHGGTVDCSSTAADGTHFTVRLPRQPA